MQNFSFISLHIHTLSIIWFINFTHTHYIYIYDLKMENVTVTTQFDYRIDYLTWN